MIQQFIKAAGDSIKCKPYHSPVEDVYKLKQIESDLLLLPSSQFRDTSLALIYNGQKVYSKRVPLEAQAAFIIEDLRFYFQKKLRA